AWGGPFLEAGEKLGAKTIAIMAADAEFAQNLCTGARAIAKAKGLQFVNYNSWVPEKTMANPAVTSFLQRYSVKAKAEKVDPLGFYLPPFNYAIGEIL